MNLTEYESMRHETEAKPCPFCGGSEICTCQYQHEAGPRYAIICMGCMASIDPGYAQDRGTVLDMWNKRHFIFQKGDECDENKN